VEEGTAVGAGGGGLERQKRKNNSGEGGRSPNKWQKFKG